MAAAQTINVNELVDAQKIGGFNIKLLVWSWLAMLLDGYDILALAFAAPHLVRLWHVDRAALGPVFSASLFGILFGAPILGYMGDRFGRKKAIVAGCLIYGVFTLLCAWATSLDQLMVLRFLVGIGLGGLMPNTIALNVELSPKRLRATMVVLMFTGVTLGGAVAGWIAQTSLIAEYGWPILFVIGGAVPILLAVGLAFALPESLKYLVLHPHRRADAARLAARLKPNQAIGPDTKFILPGGEKKSEFSPAKLFASGLAFITPLLWFLFAANLMANYFVNSWMTVLFQGAGVSPAHAALATTMFQVGGTVGGIIISLLLDRFGFIPIVALFVCGAPIVAAIGTPGLSEMSLVAVATAAGFCILGLQFGINAVSGIIYPTAIRSNGAGWAFGVGRFGSVTGPILGGVLVGMHVPLQKLFYAPALSLALGAVASLVMLRLCVARFRGYHIDDAAAHPAPGDD